MPATCKSGAKELPKSVSASTGAKRSADDLEPLASNKKAKVDAIEPASAPEVVDLTGDSDDEEESAEDEQEKDLEIPEDVQDRLDNLAGLLEGLTKGYLKDVMKELCFWGRGGTNRDMAADIAAYLEQCAHNGEDLKEEAKVIKGVHRSCWGGCHGDSDEDGSEDEY